jgi:hypothetical protein
MIELMSDLPPTVVGVSATGTVTARDYETVLIPAIEAMFKRQGRGRFLYHVGDGFKGFEVGAMWDDAVLGLKHLTGWERVAIVTDVEWLRLGFKVFAPVMPGTTRVFGAKELAEAKRWVAE